MHGNVKMDGNQHYVGRFLCPICHATAKTSSLYCYYLVVMGHAKNGFTGSVIIFAIFARLSLVVYF